VVAAVAGVGAAVAVALAPGPAFADETVAEPSTVRPGGATIVIVGCGTDADAGGATASSPLFGEVVLSHAIEPGYYRARVVVPPTAAAGTYAVTGTCGTATSRAAIVVTPGGDGAAGDKGNGPTLIGIGLIAAGAALTVLATRFRSRTRA
jgi:hypothetical protein